MKVVIRIIALTLWASLEVGGFYLGSYIFKFSKVMDITCIGASLIYLILCTIIIIKYLKEKPWRVVD